MHKQAKKSGGQTDKQTDKPNTLPLPRMRVHGVTIMHSGQFSKLW